MPKFTVLIHSGGTPEQLEKTLASVQFAKERLLIGDAHDDELRKLSRRMKARLKNAVPGVSAGSYAMDAFYDWILVLAPGEELDAGQQKLLADWQKRKRASDAAGYKVSLGHPSGEAPMRLVNRKRVNWTAELPPDDLGAQPLPRAA